MSQVKPMYKTVSAVFIALTVILAATTGYLLANPTTTTQTETQTLSSTMMISSPLYSVNIAYKPGIGFYLTNASGWTLYLLRSDNPKNGTSTCTGKCINNWPAFYIEDMTLPAGLNATSFTEITRPDGSKQLAYQGYPLYTLIKDKKPGDTVGQGIGKVWYACTIPQPTLST